MVRRCLVTIRKSLLSGGAVFNSCLKMPSVSPDLPGLQGGCRENSKDRYQREAGRPVLSPAFSDPWTCAGLREGSVLLAEVSPMRPGGLMQVMNNSVQGFCVGDVGEMLCKLKC
jgi:hypothetical protein